MLQDDCNWKKHWSAATSLGYHVMKGFKSLPASDSTILHPSLLVRDLTIDNNWNFDILNAPFNVETVHNIMKRYLTHSLENDQYIWLRNRNVMHSLQRVVIFLTKTGDLGKGMKTLGISCRTSKLMVDWNSTCMEDGERLMTFSTYLNAWRASALGVIRCILDSCGRGTDPKTLIEYLSSPLLPRSTAADSKGFTLSRMISCNCWWKERNSVSHSQRERSIADFYPLGYIHTANIHYHQLKSILYRQKSIMYERLTVSGIWCWHFSAYLIG